LGKNKPSQPRLPEHETRVPTRKTKRDLLGGMGGRTPGKTQGTGYPSSKSVQKKKKKEEGSEKVGKKRGKGQTGKTLETRAPET